MFISDGVLSRGNYMPCLIYDTNAAISACTRYGNGTLSVADGDVLGRSLLMKAGH